MKRERNSLAFLARQTGAWLTLLFLVSAMLACSHPVHKPTARELIGFYSTGAALSPREQLFAITLRSLDFSGLFLVDYGGKVRAWLHGRTPDSFVSRPAFSPDGETIAFEYRLDRTQRGIAVLEKKGTNLRRLTSSSLKDSEPRFSPDGKRIYFLRCKPEDMKRERTVLSYYDSEIFYVELQGGPEQQVTDKKHMRILDFCFSGPDTILVHAQFKRGCLRLWELNVDKPNDYWLFDMDITQFGALYSEHCQTTLMGVDNIISSVNGRHLLFTWKRLPVGKITEIPEYLYSTDLKTRQTRRLTNENNGPMSAAISPDGRKILYLTWAVDDTPGPIKPSNLWMMDHPNAKPRRLTLNFTGVADRGPVNP